MGARSETDDAEGPITAVSDIVQPDRSAVEAVLKEFVGTIEQTPPAYSAARIGGRRAYALTAGPDRRPGPATSAYRPNYAA